MCVWSRQRSCLLGGFSLESSLRSPRYLSNYWTTLKNWCVFVWPCVVLRVFAGMSLPEGKLEGGFFPNMSVRGGWYEAGVGARCTFAHSVQTSYLIWTRGVRCVCGRWSLSGPSRTQRGRVDDICLLTTISSSSSTCCWLTQARAEQVWFLFRAKTHQISITCAVKSSDCFVVWGSWSAS